MIFIRFVVCMLLPIFDVYQSSDSQYKAEINPSVDSLRSGRLPTIDLSQQTKFSHGAHGILFAPSAFSGASLWPLVPRRCHEDDATRFGINYSRGRRPRVGGRGPIFRSTACAIPIARTPREAASMPPQCGLDLRNWLPIRGRLWHFVSP